MNADMSAQLWDAARRVVPRGASSGHRVGWDQVFVRAQGAYLWDANGKQYVDFLNAWGPILLGHCDERVNQAVYQAASTCDVTGVGPQLGEIELADKVCQLLPSADKVAFCTSGTDAAMHAVHIARAATGRTKILKFHGAYHGWSDHLAVGGARTGTDRSTPLNQPNSAGLHPGPIGDVVVVEWNDLLGLQAAFADYGDQLAAAFTEPYIHSFGCVPAADGFLEQLRQLCNAHQTALVFDEVKTGFRAALGGYQSLCGVIPDITIFGKAIANGYALAGVAGRDELMGHLGAYRGDRATIDGTYNAQPYAVAAARATLAIAESEGIIERIYQLGARMREGIAAAITDLGVPACVVGLGSEWAMYFRPDPPRNFRETLDVDTERYRRYHAHLLAGGVLEPAAPTGDRRLNAATTNDDIDQALEVVRSSLRAAMDTTSTASES